jgi:hypothetical protein
MLDVVGGVLGGLLEVTTFLVRKNANFEGEITLKAANAAMAAKV